MKSSQILKNHNTVRKNLGLIKKNNGLREQIRLIMNHEKSAFIEFQNQKKRNESLRKLCLTIKKQLTNFEK